MALGCIVIKTWHHSVYVQTLVHFCLLRADNSKAKSSDKKRSWRCLLCLLITDWNDSDLSRRIITMKNFMAFEQLKKDVVDWIYSRFDQYLHLPKIPELNKRPFQ